MGLGVYAFLVCFPHFGKMETIHKIKKFMHQFFSCAGFILYSYCCGPVKGLDERQELRIMWNKYIERKYKYRIGKRVLNVSLTAKVLGWS